MRLAMLTDIHGNLPALESVLEDVATQNVDDIIVAGDIINILPFSHACWQTVMALNCPVLQGNHEFYVYSYGTAEMPSMFNKSRFKGMAWNVSLFNDTERAIMRTLPMSYRQDNLLIVHASSRNLLDSFRANTDIETVQTYFPDVHEDFIFRGHNHRWVEHHWDDKHVITVCSLGIPMESSLDAQYAIITQTSQGWDYEKRYVPYDREKILKAMDDTYLDNYGALGRIHRLELEKGEGHLPPFLQKYAEPIDAEILTIDEAVQQYLSQLN